VLRVALITMMANGKMDIMTSNMHTV